MIVRKISKKQLKVLTWWCNASPYRDFDAIICDGAVRSGKTLFMGLSFVCWAMCRYTARNFGICGKTIGSLRRNVLSSVLPLLRELGFECRDNLTRNILTIGFGGRENTFFLFGGKDEGSASLIQGVTFAGVLMDEVALMPRSFVQQACARCSVEGSKLWFNCNPEGPSHWFYTEWIKKARERRALHLHFTMRDNPSLSKRIRERYEKMYDGAFYRRFILGEWVAAEGLVYDFFDSGYVAEPPDGPCEEYYISCDYGTVNPASFGLWGRRGDVWYRLREYYYDSRREGSQKTDAEYAEELGLLARGVRVRAVVADPSASSFIECLRREGYPVLRAKNDVLSGIRITADLLKRRKLVICSPCRDAIREFGLYVWDEGGGDCVVKKNDHAMDDIRYFAATVVHRGGGDAFAALSAER